MAPMPAAPRSVDNENNPLFTRLRRQLGRSRTLLTDGLHEILRGGRTIDDALLEELEEILLIADIGIEATQTILGQVAELVRGKEATEPSALYHILKQQMVAILQPCARPLEIHSAGDPFVVMIVGVNGVGKTTTIGKLAYQLKQRGYAVMLAAADTFRAAATEQLQAWGNRVAVPVIAQQQGADAASVAHDAMQSATARGVDVLLVDTAGRQHTHHNLMEELKKIKRVMGKLREQAPHEVLMVLDAGNGQNALSQLQRFHSTVGITGLCLTKLDGTAKGGILLAAANKTGLPIRYIGVGEDIEDLRDFNAAEFVEALLPEEDAR